MISASEDMKKLEQEQKAFLRDSETGRETIAGALDRVFDGNDKNKLTVDQYIELEKLLPYGQFAHASTAPFTEKLETPFTQVIFRFPTIESGEESFEELRDYFKDCQEKMPAPVAEPTSP